MCVVAAIISAQSFRCQIVCQIIFVYFAQSNFIINPHKKYKAPFSLIFNFPRRIFLPVFCANCKKIGGYNLVTIVTSLFLFTKSHTKNDNIFLNKKIKIKKMPDLLDFFKKATQKAS